MKHLSYNKVELKENMIVYQMMIEANGNPVLLEYKVTELLLNNKIKIKFEKDIDGSKITEEKEVDTGNVHTNGGELINIWIESTRKKLQLTQDLITKLENMLINSSQKEVEI
jgi:hypothetical protein